MYFLITMDFSDEIARGVYVLLCGYRLSASIRGNQAYLYTYTYTYIYVCVCIILIQPIPTHSTWTFIFTIKLLTFNILYPQPASPTRVNIIPSSTSPPFPNHTIGSAAPLRIWILEDIPHLSISPWIDSIHIFTPYIPIDTQTNTFQ